MQNKANFDGTGSMEQRTDSRGQSRRTKPIRCGRQGRDALATNALRRHYEREPFCETKPIWCGRQGRDALATNALRRHYEREPFCETKPIPGPGGPGTADRRVGERSGACAATGIRSHAKQSQFSRDGQHGATDRHPRANGAKQSQFGAEDKGGRPSPRTPYGVATNGRHSAKQSQSARASSEKKRQKGV